MVAPLSQEVIDSAKSTSNENPNFIFHTPNVSGFGAHISNDLEGAGLSVHRLDMTQLNYTAFITPDKSTIDSEVLIFENVQSTDAISAGMIVALIMTRLTGKEMWRGKTVVLVASDGKWRDPELKDVLEDLIESGTVIDPID